MPSDELIEIDTKDILFILENLEEKILFWWLSVQSNIKSNLIFWFSSIKDLKFNECSLIIVVLLTLLSLCFEIFDFDFPISFRS